MPDLPPMDQVPAVKDWHTWKILKRAVHQEIILPYTADAWVRIKAGDDWVVKFSSIHSLHRYHKYLLGLSMFFISLGNFQPDGFDLKGSEIQAYMAIFNHQVSFTFFQHIRQGCPFDG